MFWQATISVVCERDESVAASNIRQRQLATDFMEKLNAYGYPTRCFDPAGQDDIGGGCGQLWFVQEWMRNNPELARLTTAEASPSCTRRVRHEHRPRLARRRCGLPGTTPTTPPAAPLALPLVRGGAQQGRSCGAHINRREMRRLHLAAKRQHRRTTQ